MEEGSRRVIVPSNTFIATWLAVSDCGATPIPVEPTAEGFNIDPATGRWHALSGVNITLGLPVIRTSVDHGTAFDIAGKGIASETSLIEAIEYAERLAAART